MQAPAQKREGDVAAWSKRRDAEISAFQFSAFEEGYLIRFCPKLTGRPRRLDRPSGHLPPQLDSAPANFQFLLPDFYLP
jgi:hypothetical protein